LSIYLSLKSTFCYHSLIVFPYKLHPRVLSNHSLFKNSVLQAVRVRDVLCIHSAVGTCEVPRNRSREPSVVRGSLVYNTALQFAKHISRIQNIYVRNNFCIEVKENNESNYVCLQIRLQQSSRPEEYRSELVCLSGNRPAAIMLVQ